MNKIAYIAVVLTVLFPVLTLNSGCEEEQNKPNIRKSRLLADENLRLTTELKRLNRQLDKQTKMLEDCRQEQAELKKNSDELTSSVMDAFGECQEDNLRLQKENEKLRSTLK